MDLKELSTKQIEENVGKGLKELTGKEFAINLLEIIYDTGDSIYSISPEIRLKIKEL